MRRYHSVTFRGQPLARAVFSGGESTQALVDVIAARVDLKCELGDPLRTYEFANQTGRKGMWDVATGLALTQPWNRRNSAVPMSTTLWRTTYFVH